MISNLIKKFLIEDIEKDIYSILGSSIPVKEKMFKLGENFGPRMDYVKADLFIRLYRKEHFGNYTQNTNNRRKNDAR